MESTHLPWTELLTEERGDQIVGEAIKTLEKIGVAIENREAVERLAGAGASVSNDGKRVFIPESLVERSIDTAPERFTLFDRDGEPVASVGDDQVIFDPGSAAISIYDVNERRSRKPSTRDVVEFVVVADRLAAYDAQSTGVVPNDVPYELADRFRLFLGLVYSRKPIITGTFTKDAFPVMLAMLTEVRGGAQALKEKPLAVFDCCPSPPLMWSDLTCQALMDCAANGVPAETVSMPLAGATAPVTLAGALVQHTAESLSGLVIHQTVNPGAPIVYGGAPAIFDMRKGTTPLAAVETMMIEMAYAQIGKSFALPVHGYMALSDSKLPDFQAGFETAMGATLAVLSRVNVVSGPGMLDFSSCQSLEKLVLDAEVCTVAKRLIEGIRFRDETAGFDVLREITGRAGASFMTAEHTRRYFREEMYYPSGAVDRATYGDWERAGKRSAAQRAHARVAELLGEPKTSVATQDLIDRLESIITADARKHGLESLPEWRVFLQRSGSR
jgi:trimethylamine--corrinoid protein Co-methyltransferase